MNHDKGERSHGLGGTASLFFIAFAAIGAFFLITEHRAHLYGALPWLLLLAVPLLHVFMHSGHGHGGHGGEARRDRTEAGIGPPSSGSGAHRH